MGITRHTQSISAVIAISTTPSTSFKTAGLVKGSYQTPAALTGTTITIQVSNDNSTWSTLRDSAGTALAAVTVAVDSNYTLPIETFSHQFARLVSGSSEAAARTLAVELSG